MNLNEMNEAIRDAERTLRLADQKTNDMANLLIGRLRNVKRYGVLEALKRELRDYNMHTGEWK